MVDYGDNLLLREILYVALTADVERGGLRRLLTLDDEVLLLVYEVCIVVSIDNPSSRYTCTTAIYSLTVHYTRAVLTVGNCIFSRICLTAVVIGYRRAAGVGNPDGLNQSGTFACRQNTIGA